MISKLEINGIYHVIGIGSWSDFRQDIQVISVTKMENVDRLELPIYDKWFAGYDVAESKYAALLESNSYVYICKKLASRNPSTLQEDGEDVYLFPDMIDYAESSKLILCKTYQWEIHTRPYTPDDSLNPLTMGVDVKTIINDALYDKIYDTINAYRNATDVIVSESEYEVLRNARLARQAKVTASKANYKSTIANHETHLYNGIITLEDEKEKIRLLNLQADQFMQTAVKKLSTNTTTEIQLTARDTTLRAIYDQLLTINQNLPSGEQLVIPPYSELGN